MLHSDEISDTAWAKANPVEMRIAVEFEDEILESLLKRLALPIVLIWAAHAVLPAVITYLLVLPALVLLPLAALNAARWIRMGRRLGVS